MPVKQDGMPGMGGMVPAVVYNNMPVSMPRYSPSARRHRWHIFLMWWGLAWERLIRLESRKSSRRRTGPSQTGLPAPGTDVYPDRYSVSDMYSVSDSTDIHNGSPLGAERGVPSCPPEIEISSIADDSNMSKKIVKNINMVQSGAGAMSGKSPKRGAKNPWIPLAEFGWMPGILPPRIVVQRTGRYGRRVNDQWPPELWFPTHGRRAMLVAEGLRRFARITGRLWSRGLYNELGKIARGDKPFPCWIVKQCQKEYMKWADSYVDRKRRTLWSLSETVGFNIRGLGH